VCARLRSLLGQVGEHAGGHMNIIELRDYCQKMIDDGRWDTTVPVMFREYHGELSKIDYAVVSNDKKCILFSEEGY
jgi:hypothetical protein